MIPKDTKSAKQANTELTSSVWSIGLSLFLVLIFLGLLGGVKYWQIKEAMAQHSMSGPPPTGVTTLVVQKQPWTNTYLTPGRVRASKGSTLALETGGIVQELPAQGKDHLQKDHVQAGEILLRLNSAVEQADLARARAQSARLQTEATRAEKLKQRKAIADEQYDQAISAAAEARSEVLRLEALVDNKVLKAPFAGRLGIFQVDIGDYLPAGTPVVVMSDTSKLEIDFSLPQSLLPMLSQITSVKVSLEPFANDQLELPVIALGASFGAQTLTIPMRANLPHDKLPTELRDKILPGTVLTLEVPAEPTQEVIVVPASAIAYAPYGNAVYVVEPSADQSRGLRSIQKRTVTIGLQRGDYLPILAGLEAGEEIVSTGVFKLNPGVKVMVDNNSVQLDSIVKSELEDR